MQFISSGIARNKNKYPMFIVKSLRYFYSKILFNKKNDTYLTKGDGYYFELYVMIRDKNGNRKKFTILDCVLCGRQSSHYFNSLINTDKVIPH